MRPFYDKNQGSYFIVWTCQAEPLAMNAWFFHGRLDFVSDRWFFSNLHRFQNFPHGTFIESILPPHRPLARRVRLSQICNDFTLLGFNQAGCLKFHPFPVAIHRIKGSRKWWVKYAPTNQVQTNNSGSKCVLKQEIAVVGHNIIQMHNNIMWDGQYFVKYSSHSIWMVKHSTKYC